ncbi:hypothetical protein MJH12_01820 [bacterium]|nr:hypothetical protein [bacterium]
MFNNMESEYIGGKLNPLYKIAQDGIEKMTKDLVGIRKDVRCFLDKNGSKMHPNTRISWELIYKELKPGQGQRVDMHGDGSTMPWYQIGINYKNAMWEDGWPFTKKGINEYHNDISGTYHRGTGGLHINMGAKNDSTTPLKTLFHEFGHKYRGISGKSDSDINPQSYIDENTGEFKSIGEQDFGAGISQEVWSGYGTEDYFGRHIQNYRSKNK